MSQFPAERDSGRSKALGRSTISWPSELIYSILMVVGSLIASDGEFVVLMAQGNLRGAAGNEYMS